MTEIAKSAVPLSPRQIHDALWSAHWMNWYRQHPDYDISVARPTKDEALLLPQLNTTIGESLGLTQFTDWTTREIIAFTGLSTGQISDVAAAKDVKPQDAALLLQQAGQVFAATADQPRAREELTRILLIRPGQELPAFWTPDRMGLQFAEALRRAELDLAQAARQKHQTKTPLPLAPHVAGEETELDIPQPAARFTTGRAIDLLRFGQSISDQLTDTFDVATPMEARMQLADRIMYIGRFGQPVKGVIQDLSLVRLLLQLEEMQEARRAEFAREEQVKIMASTQGLHYEGLAHETHGDVEVFSTEEHYAAIPAALEFTSEERDQHYLPIREPLVVLDQPTPARRTTAPAYQIFGTEPTTGRDVIATDIVVVGKDGKMQTVRGPYDLAPTSRLSGIRSGRQRVADQELAAAFMATR